MKEVAERQHTINVSIVLAEYVLIWVASRLRLTPIARESVDLTKSGVPRSEENASACQ